MTIFEKIDKTFGNLTKKATKSSNMESMYDWVGDFSEGLATVKLNWKFGYIDKTGKEVIPLKYDYASEFSAGIAAAELYGNWGYIDKQGNWRLYNKTSSALPESITKITISDIRYMVNECINRLNYSKI